MLQVVSTIPGSNGVDVYIDSVIKIKFNQEVATVSLAKTLFNLYAVTGTAPNEVYQSTNVTYSKNPNDLTEVWITPQGDLLSNQKYLLLIKGDSNTADAVIQGIVSITNQVMNGNYLLNFTTTNKRAPAPNIAVNVTPAAPQPVTNGETTTYSNVDGAGNITTPEHLEVIGTEPADLFNITHLQKLRILFNQYVEPVVASGDILLLQSMVIDTTMQEVELPIQSIEVSGDHIDVILKGYMETSGVCSIVDNDPLVPETSRLPRNHKFRILLNAGSLKVVGRNDVLLDNYQIDIDSELYPSIASVFETRAWSRGILNDRVADATIAYSIRQNTKWIMDRFGLSYNFCTGFHHIGDEVLPFFRQWVMCQSIYDSARTYYNTIGYFRIASKHLGDMSVGYTNPTINALANPLKDSEDCAANMLTYIIAKMGKGVKTPTKSSSPETQSYPGRFRTEFMRRPVPDPNQFYDRMRNIRYYEHY